MTFQKVETREGEKRNTERKKRVCVFSLRLGKDPRSLEM